MKMQILPAIAGWMTVGMILCPPGAPSAGQDAATILNSGSTNRPGFRIVIDPSGSAEYTSVPRRAGPQAEPAKPMQATLARALIERFYADLKAAKPFASLPAVHCMKSASFGSTLTIAFGGEQTPDLSCGDGGNAVVANLIRDANEIIALFHDSQ